MSRVRHFMRSPKWRPKHAALFLAITILLALVYRICTRPTGRGETIQAARATTPSTDAPAKAPRRRRKKPRRRPMSCPFRHAVNHTLENTGRRALVFYTFTSHDNLQDRQIELDNYLFFQAHGVVAPDTPTALFSAVDYIVLRSDPDRLAPSEDKNATNTIVADTTGVFECSTSGNVRIVETPSSPCDLCAIGRTVTALGGPNAVAESYEYIVVVNSGTRGPFFSEAPRSAAGGPSPVTWIDDLALGGEKVYTGAIMVGSGGSADKRAFLQSFAIAFPGSAMIPMHPVLMGGCIEDRIPKLWFNYADSYDVDLHKNESVSDILQNLRAVLAHGNQAVWVAKVAREGDAAPANCHQSPLDIQMQKGLEKHVSVTAQVVDRLSVGGDVIDPWNNERKMRCVYRCELQLTKTVFESMLPPMRPMENGVRSTAPPRQTTLQPANVAKQPSRKLPAPLSFTSRKNATRVEARTLRPESTTKKPIVQRGQGTANRTSLSSRNTTAAARNQMAAGQVAPRVPGHSGQKKLMVAPPREERPVPHPSLQRVNTTAGKPLRNPPTSRRLTTFENGTQKSTATPKDIVKHLLARGEAPRLHLEVDVKYPRSVMRPHLTPAQMSMLTPVLSMYLKEGHFFVRSLHHNATMVNMGHAAVVMERTLEQIKRGEHYNVDACDVVFLKFGGAGWRAHQIPERVITRVQELSVLQAAATAAKRLSSPPAATATSATLVDVLGCPALHAVRPLR